MIQEIDFFRSRIDVMIKRDKLPIDTLLERFPF